MTGNGLLSTDRPSDRVESLMRGGAAFAAVEQEIEAMEVGRDHKAALWLLSWSLREPGAQLHDARELVALTAG